MTTLTAIFCIVAVFCALYFLMHNLISSCTDSTSDKISNKSDRQDLEKEHIDRLELESYSLELKNSVGKIFKYNDKFYSVLYSRIGSRDLDSHLTPHKSMRWHYGLSSILIYSFLSIDSGPTLIPFFLYKDSIKSNDLTQDLKDFLDKKVELPEDYFKKDIEARELRLNQEFEEEVKSRVQDVFIQHLKYNDAAIKNKSIPAAPINDFNSFLDFTYLAKLDSQFFKNIFVKNYLNLIFSTSKIDSTFVYSQIASQTNLSDVVCISKPSDI